VSRKEHLCICTQENDDICVECLRKREQIAGFGTKKWGSKTIACPHSKKWESTDPIDPVLPRSMISLCSKKTNKYETKNLGVLNNVMFIGKPDGSNRSRGLLLKEIRYTVPYCRRALDTIVLKPVTSKHLNAK